MGSGWQRTKRITSAAFRPVRGRDLSLHAAAITFYGAIAVVPVALLAIWLTGLIAGADRVRRLTAYAVRCPAHRDRRAPGGGRAGRRRGGADPAAGAGLAAAGVALRRGAAPGVRLGGGAAHRRAPGRLAGPAAAAAAARAGPGAAAVDPAGAAAHHPAWSARAAGSARWAWCCRSWRCGWCSRRCWSGCSGWSARHRRTGSPRSGSGSFTAANLSGFLHGFVLFCSLPLDLGVPFGGFDEIGGGGGRAASGSTCST